MARNWNSRWNSNRWDAKDPWQYREQEDNYVWLKQSVVAALIFALVYGAYTSGTSLGRNVTDAVRYVLTIETDFAYLADQIANYAPKGMDVSVLKRIQSSMAKPADPLMYMTKPVTGKVVSLFGWRTNPVSKQEMMHEGIDIEASVGASVKAAAAGKVKMVIDSAQYGTTLIIEHSQDIDTIYGHLGEVLVKPEEAISQGQVVARIGKTGQPTTPILYFEVREKGKAIDPLTRIKGETPVKEGK